MSVILTRLNCIAPWLTHGENSLVLAFRNNGIPPF